MNTQPKVIEQVNIPEDEAPEVTATVMKLMIVLNFDLRGIEPKIYTIKATPLCTGWMVFLNKAGNLAHIMNKDETDDGTYIRMTIKHNLKNAHPNFIRRYFYNRMIARYII